MTQVSIWNDSSGPVAVAVRDVAQPADARAEAAAMAERLELRRQELIGQRARLDEEISRVTVERQRRDLVVYAASRVRPCPECGRPMDGAEQSWIGGIGWVFGTYCVGCRLAAQGLSEDDSLEDSA